MCFVASLWKRSWRRAAGTSRIEIGRSDRNWLGQQAQSNNLYQVQSAGCLTGELFGCPLAPHAAKDRADTTLPHSLPKPAHTKLGAQMCRPDGPRWPLPRQVLGQPPPARSMWRQKMSPPLANVPSRHPCRDPSGAQPREANLSPPTDTEAEARHTPGAPLDGLNSGGSSPKLRQTWKRDYTPTSAEGADGAVCRRDRSCSYTQRRSLPWRGSAPCRSAWLPRWPESSLPDRECPAALGRLRAARLVHRQVLRTNRR